MAGKPKAAPVPQTVQIAKNASKSGDKVTIACKMPNGVVLRLFEMDEAFEPVMGGGTRKFHKAREIAQVEVFGNAAPAGEYPKTRVVAGYALTQGVDKDFWDRWLAANKDSLLVKNGLIMAYPTTESTIDAAKDGHKVKSGLQPIDPAGDDRRPRSMNANVTEAQPFKDERAA